MVSSQIERFAGTEISIALLSSSEQLKVIDVESSGGLLQRVIASSSNSEQRSILSTDVSTADGKGESPVTMLTEVAARHCSPNEARMENVESAELLCSACTHVVGFPSTRRRNSFCVSLLSVG